MQSKLHSLFESKANIIIGLPVSYIINYFMLPLLSEPLANKEHWAFLVVSAVFTIVSIVRSYTLRRLFNHIGKKNGN